MAFSTSKRDEQKHPLAERSDTANARVKLWHRHNWTGRPVAVTGVPEVRQYRGPMTISVAISRVGSEMTDIKVCAPAMPHIAL